MVTVRCEDINPICWAWVIEYARKKRIEKRCKALEMIIEDHMKFTKRAYEKKQEERLLAKKTKK